MGFCKAELEHTGKWQAVNKNIVELRHDVALRIVFVSETLSDTACLATAAECHNTMSLLPQDCPF